MSDSAIDRSSINFAQAEGAEDLPRQLELREVSQETRSLIWPIIWSPMDEVGRKSSITYSYASLSGVWRNIMLRWHVHILHKFADDFDQKVVSQIEIAKLIIAFGTYTEFFKFLEFVARDREAPYRFAELVNNALTASRSAYRLVDGSVVAMASEEDARAVLTAFAQLRSGKLPGARHHLLEAGRELTAGNWAASIRESIHSVESAARVLAPGTNTLAPALLALEKTGTIHKALKVGFGALYGFSSDEDGIRHPLLDQDEANVTEADALYMFGACAAFLTYLSLKAAG